MFTPLITVVPASVKVKPPAPENEPESVALQELGFRMVLAFEILKAALERSPRRRASVPAASTGLAPIEDKAILLPLVMVEMLVVVEPPEPLEPLELAGDDDIGLRVPVLLVPVHAKFVLGADPLT